MSVSDAPDHYAQQKPDRHGARSNWFSDLFLKINTSTRDAANIRVVRNTAAMDSNNRT
jgi:hypothetical protein